MNKELNGIKFGLLSKENKFPDCKFENINFIKSKFFLHMLILGKNLVMEYIFHQIKSN